MPAPDPCVAGDSATAIAAERPLPHIGKLLINDVGAC
jgi:hypothetical protein